MLSRLSMVVGLFALVACGGESPEPDGGAESDDALIDGRIANANEMPAILRLDEGCTATKVGPRLILTASHCIRGPQGEVSASYAAGREMPVQVQDGRGGIVDKRVKIKRAAIHPRMTEVCKSPTGCQGNAANAKRDAPDIAVIELTTDLTEVPVMPVDLRPTFPGERLTATGFGCTDGAHARNGDDGKLRVGGTRVVNAEAASASGSPVNMTEATDLANDYVYTAGPNGPQPANGASDLNSGLCPGDSGGPLVRKSPDGKLSVVGVNASYTFRWTTQDPVGKPVTNWHSRVDVAARHGVLEWLKAMGASVVP